MRIRVITITCGVEIYIRENPAETSTFLRIAESNRVLSTTESLSMKVNSFQAPESRDRKLKTELNLIRTDGRLAKLPAKAAANPGIQEACTFCSVLQQHRRSNAVEAEFLLADLNFLNQSEKAQVDRSTARLLDDFSAFDNGQLSF